MSLDERLIRSGGMSRRDFLGLAGKSLILGVTASIIGCKSNPVGPEVPSEVDLGLYFRNATQGEIFNRSVRAKPGSELILYAGEVQGKPNSNVDDRRITVRDSVVSPGGLVAHSVNGSVVFKVPSRSSDYGVYLYDKGNGADYNIIDDNVLGSTRGSRLIFGLRHYRVSYEDRDGQVCPDGVWFGMINGYVGALDQLSNGLKAPFFDWGSISKVSSAGHFGVGAGDCEGNYGINIGNWAGINYNKIGDSPEVLVKIAMEEGYENITQVGNIGGRVSWLTLAPFGVLTPVGRDYLIYTFAKDVAGDTK